MSFVCFGEILWDVFPEQRRLGGAPLNVAYYLTQLGHPCQLISAVGQDELGKEALEIIRDAGISTALVEQLEAKETGQVIVSLDEKGAASYTFKDDAAWDWVGVPTDESTFSTDDTLVFGSLAGRSSSNRERLKQLMCKGMTHAFDLNLRPPFDDLNWCVELMDNSHIIKLNDEELTLVCEYLNLQQTYLPDQLAAIDAQFNAETVCVTCGPHGAVMIHGGELYTHPGVETNVKDTVGAGDAFLAGLLASLQKQVQPDGALSTACAIGSIVASQSGAQTPIDTNHLNSILEKGNKSVSHQI